MTFSESVLSFKLTVAVTHGLQCGKGGTEGWCRMMAGDMWKTKLGPRPLCSQQPRGTCGSQVRLLFSLVGLLVFIATVCGFKPVFLFPGSLETRLHFESLSHVCVSSEHAGVLLSVKRNNPETNKNVFHLSMPRDLTLIWYLVSREGGRLLPVPPISKENLISRTVDLLE